MRILFGAMMMIVGTCTASCTYVPPLPDATGSIPIRDVVDRVKCEMADAFGPKLHHRKFKWLQLWTAKVDLTLIADNTGSITPVGAYIEPLAAVGGVAQQFSLGASVNFSGEALRTESLSFSLSLVELRDWRRDMLAESVRRNLPDPCIPGSRDNLGGNLGLAEWADSALSPVRSDDLQAGDHPAPGVAKAAAKAAPGNKFIAYLSQTARQIAVQAEKDTKTAATGARKSAGDATASSRRAVKSIDDSLFRAVEDREFLRVSRQIAGAAEEQAKTARQDADEAEQLSKHVSDIAATIAEDDNSEPALTKAKALTPIASEATRLALDAAEQAKAASENAGNVVVRVPDPPIDSISHSVQFIVNVGASIAPSWTLVRFRGPTGNLAGLSAKQTHTLNIALGPRGDNGARYSQEAVRALNNLTLQQIRVTQ